MAWQWSKYPASHRSRRILLVHALTAPLFMAGTLVFLASPFTRTFWFAVVGLGLMLLVMAVQGRTHRLEAVKPAPFRGPQDVIQRFFVEQWATFPRYVLTGGFAQAWREGTK